jgi:hypothetical protein
VVDLRFAALGYPAILALMADKPIPITPKQHASTTTTSSTALHLLSLIVCSSFFFSSNIF